MVRSEKALLFEPDSMGLNLKLQKTGINRRKTRRATMRGNSLSNQLLQTLSKVVCGVECLWLGCHTRLDK